MALPKLVEGAALLRDGPGLYPRVVRLEHQKDPKLNGRVLAAVTVPTGVMGQDPHIPIYQSLDGGKTFSSAPIGKVSDDLMNLGLCCIALYELPRAAGDLPAGALLAGASLSQFEIGERRMSLGVYVSLDAGKSWKKRSSCVEAQNGGGLWEPEFVLLTDGSLTCHYSDETEQPKYSQFLAMVVSKDGGKTWGKPVKTVASSDPKLRPGMSTVRRLSSGKYAMTYEVCGFENCAAFIRTSSDGLNWGDPTNLGTRIQTSSGRYPAHTPVLSWVKGPGPEGRLLLSFQMYYENPLLESDQMGKVLLYNDQGGVGPWREFPAPMQLSGIYDNYCPNYSSPLLPSSDGKSVLMLATQYEGGSCKPYYAVGKLPE